MRARIPPGLVNCGLALAVAIWFAGVAPAAEGATGPPAESSPSVVPLPDPSTSPVVSPRSQSAPPPVRQALVPEGVLALRLAQALKLGDPDDEAQAEQRLVDAGITPRNGWISDYPVTPAVLGDLDRAVAEAAAAGKLPLAKDQAASALAALKRELALDVAAAAGPAAAPAPPAEEKIYKWRDRRGVIHFTNKFDSIPEEYRPEAVLVRAGIKHPPPAAEPEGMAPDSAAPASPEVINDYYYQEGPPVVTYYPPPDPYLYLYAWQPYPFWSFGYYFPGFFVLRDFHRPVWYHHHWYPVGNHMGGYPHPYHHGPTPWSRPPRPGVAPTQPHDPWRTQRDMRGILNARPGAPVPGFTPRRPGAALYPNPPPGMPGAVAGPRLGRQHGFVGIPRDSGLPRDPGYRGFAAPAPRFAPGGAFTPHVFPNRPALPAPGRGWGGAGSLHGGGFGGFRGGGGFGGGGYRGDSGFSGFHGGAGPGGLRGGGFGGARGGGGRR